MKNLVIIGMLSLLAACAGTSLVYPNANEPASRAGKEDWPLVIIDASGVSGMVLISTVRDDANLFKKMKSVVHANFKREALLDPDHLNSISVKYQRGNNYANYTMMNIDVDRDKIYTLYPVVNGREFSIELRDEAGTVISHKKRGVFG